MRHLEHGTADSMHNPHEFLLKSLIHLRPYTQGMNENPAEVLLDPSSNTYIFPIKTLLLSCPLPWASILRAPKTSNSTYFMPRVLFLGEGSFGVGNAVVKLSNRSRRL